jgi:hypothetical protein
MSRGLDSLAGGAMRGFVRSLDPSEFQFMDGPSEIGVPSPGHPLRQWLVRS